jgi:hypothetical protein
VSPFESLRLATDRRPEVPTRAGPVSETSFIAKFAAQTLLSERTNLDVVELTCDLVVADARFNSWCAGRKNDRESPFSEDDWVSLLDRYDTVQQHLQAALDAFLRSEWPRGAYEIWQLHTAAFVSALRAAKTSIDDLGREHGRSNQRP